MVATTHQNNVRSRLATFADTEPSRNYTINHGDELTFNPGDLYAYLNGKSPSESPSLEEIRTLFEREFHTLPTQLIRRARMEINFQTMATNDDTPPDNAEIFVTRYIRHYLYRNELPPLDERAETRVHDNTVVNAFTINSIRTGLFIGSFLQKQYRRLVRLTVGTSDPDTTPDPADDRDV